MSYDLMVLDKHERFKSSDDFLRWYDEVTEWSDDIDYNDYHHATPNLQSWFLEIKDIIRPINGEFAPSDEELNGDGIHEADYNIAKDCIYIAFDYTDSELAYSLSKALAKKYNLILFDISGYNQLVYPDGFVLKVQPKSQEDIETEFVKEFKAKVAESFAQQPSFETFQKEQKRRSWIANCIVVACGLLFAYVSYILLQLGCFKSVMPFFALIFMAVFLVLAYYIHKWEQKADDYIRSKYKAESITKETAVNDEMIERFPKPDSELQSLINRVPSTRLILFYRETNSGINKEWKSWACEMMEAGFSQPSIIQLAGEDMTVNPFEFRSLIDTIFKDLDIDCPSEIAYSQYALWIAHQVVNGDITAERGLSILCRAAIDTDYNDILLDFYYLEDEADRKRNHIDGPESYAYGYMREDNIEEWLTLYFKKLIAANV